MNALHDEKDGVSCWNRAPTTRDNYNFVRGKRSNSVTYVIQQQRQGGLDLVWQILLEKSLRIDCVG
jgi:hypothetical protein